MVKGLKPIVRRRNGHSGVQSTQVTIGNLCYGPRMADDKTRYIVKKYRNVRDDEETANQGIRAKKILKNDYSLNAYLVYKWRMKNQNF